MHDVGSIIFVVGCLYASLYHITDLIDPDQCHLAQLQAFRFPVPALL